MNTAFYSVCTSLYYVFSQLVHPVKVTGGENMPLDGKAILCANHQSLQDPLVLATYVKRRMHFMAKKELFKNKLFGKVLSALGAFPVARGQNDLGAIRTAFKLLSEDEALGIFPEGTRFTDGEMHEAKNGVSMIALRTGAQVIPAYIIGNYKPFRKMRVVIGKRVDLSDLGGKCDANTMQIASERIRAAMISLKEG
ncbi:MAG: 1-acyl-sn-glycerol-3-phosphate acyltransferase [Clostridia bacterium]|nr:1-acyl-sn-glycerol-3-phosphate acyltransferase [Clostridia bacterium]